MWLVLLDHSESMGGGFTNPPRAGWLVHKAEASTRLDAAKDVLLEQLSRLPPEMPVALFGFTSRTAYLLTAPAGAIERFRAALAPLSPSNGTDIARALSAAADYIDSLAERPLLRRVLLVSDGESELEPAVAAAKRCRDLGMTIDALLIDPGEESERVASGVTGVTAGRWEPIVSSEQLQRATSTSARMAQQEFLAARMALARLDAEEAEMTAQRQATSGQVMFSAGYPARIAPQWRYRLKVVMHHEQARDEVRQRLEKLFRDSDQRPRVTEADTSQAIRHGTVVRIEPAAEGVIFEPATAELQWLGVDTEAQFTFQYIRPVDINQSLRGAVDVKLQNGLIVAVLDLGLMVLKTKARRPRQETLVTGSTPIERVFASYAHADELVVRACKEVYAGIGITLWMDYYDIPQTAVWRNAIQIAIGKADLFQLFWSTPAASSMEVRKEIDLARLVGQVRPYPFLRAVYWEPKPPPPPEELADLQMQRLVLGHLNFATVPTRDPIRRTVRELDIAEQVAVLSLVPDTGNNTHQFVRDLMSRIVAFLEETTGLRYVPAQTLLVDRITVRSVRKVETTDKPDIADPNPRDIPSPWLLPMLDSLLLKFPCREP